MTNVGILTMRHMEAADMFGYTVEYDDAFKMLKSITKEDFADTVKRGLEETERRLWNSRHGLDKHGRPKADSLYVAGEGATSADMLAILSKAKEHMHDTEVAMRDVLSMERDDDKEVQIIDDDVAKVEEEERQATALEEEVDRALLDSEVTEAKLKREDAREELLQRFRIVPTSALPGGDNHAQKQSVRKTLLEKKRKDMLLQKHASRWKKRATGNKGGLRGRMSMGRRGIIRVRIVSTRRRIVRPRRSVRRGRAITWWIGWIWKVLRGRRRLRILRGRTRRRRPGRNHCGSTLLCHNDMHLLDGRAG